MSDLNDQEEFINADEVQEVLEDGNEMDEDLIDDENDMDEENVDMEQYAAELQEEFNQQDDSIQGFFEHKEPVFTVAFHPSDITMAASGGGNDESYLWNPTTGDKIVDLGKHTDSVSAIAFNHDGTFVASAGLDGKLFIFNLQGELQNTLEGPTEISWVNWHPRGNVIIAGGEDGTVWMWSVPSGQCMNVFTGHADAATCGQFTPNGKSIVTGCADGSIVVWDPKTGAAMHKWTAADGRFHQAGITSLSVSKDSSMIASGAEDGTTRLLQISTTKIVGNFDDHPSSVESIEFCKDYPYVATSDVDGHISVWDYTNMKLRFSAKHEEAVTKLKWSHNGTLLSASFDCTIKNWDARTGALLHTLKGHHNAILDFDVHKDRVVTGSDDGTCLVFAI
ncbi:quinon protein alcohol dehydrogenase-like superfamily [Globomyces pollinis-pini]|nr:quinon protein alcohol dehydrogenase-like superfamily [Globomyces pollinis-pini]